MNDFFIELIKNKFSVHLLENQIDGMNGIQKKEYLNFVMNGFEKREIFYWLKIFKAFEETGKLYLFDEDFPSDYFGTIGFYIENPDEEETSFDMITETSLNEFIKQCNRLLKYDIKNISSIELQNDTTNEPNENDFLKSTIDEYLEPFKNNMNEGDYNILVSAIKQHIETGSFPKLKKEIKINGKPNQKKFGWAINRIYCAKNMGVEKALLIFAHQKISLFKNTEFNEKDFLKCNLYKYFTTNK